MVCRVVPTLQSKTAAVLKICPNRTIHCHCANILLLYNIVQISPSQYHSLSGKGCINLNHDANNYRNDVNFIRDSQQYFSFDRKVQKGLQIAVGWLLLINELFRLLNGLDLFCSLQSCIFLKFRFCAHCTIVVCGNCTNIPTVASDWFTGRWSLESCGGSNLWGALGV